MMKKSKQKRLEKAGWRIGSADEFLELTDEESALISMKQNLMDLVKETRDANEITQVALAKLLNSSQSRVAKLENGSPDVSLDLIIRALFAMGVSSKKLGKAITAS